MSAIQTVQKPSFEQLPEYMAGLFQEFREFRANILTQIQPQQTPQFNGLRTLSAKAVGDKLHCSEKTVLKHAREGKLPSINIPGFKTIFFLEDDINEYIKAHRSHTDAALDAEADDYIRRKGSLK